MHYNTLMVLYIHVGIVVIVDMLYTQYTHRNMCTYTHRNRRACGTHTHARMHTHTHTHTHTLVHYTGTTNHAAKSTQGQDQSL